MVVHALYDFAALGYLPAHPALPSRATDSSLHPPFSPARADFAASAAMLRL